jgi:hypothetical protein
MCYKKPYASYAHAKADARAMRHKTHVAFGVYRCPDCHRWHCGSQGKDMRARRVY